MALHVRGNGLTINDDLRQFAEKKVARLDRLIDRIDETKLELRHNHTRSGPDTITAQLTVLSGRTTLRAEEHDPDAKHAIDRAIDKLLGQMRRVHSKRANRRAAGETIRTALQPASPAPAFGTGDVETDDGDDLGVVVRTKRFALKPMPVDEAIEQMELLGHDFYLFHNADEDTLSVVYKRRSGDYGLLVPDRG